MLPSRLVASLFFSLHSSLTPACCSGCSEADKKKLIAKTVIKLIEHMQLEIKEFLAAALGEDEVDASSAEVDAPERGSLLNRDTLVSSTDSTKKGIFSLSISTESNSGSQSKSGSVRTRRRRRSSLGASTSATLVTSMSGSQFATTVLFTSPIKPSVRHALPLRKYVARWCDGLVLAVKELGGLSSQVDQSARDFLDGVIEKKVRSGGRGARSEALQIPRRLVSLGANTFFFARRSSSLCSKPTL